METIEIKVLPKDIKNGVKGDSANCAIAKTLQRMYPEALSLSVRSSYASFRDFKSYGVTYIELPLEAQRFIEDFDAGVEVKPFTFMAEVIE